MSEYTIEELASVVQQVLSVTSDKALLYAQRLKDMFARRISPKEAEMYLKSAGWYNEDLVALYAELQKMDAKDLEEIMAKKKEAKTDVKSEDTAIPASVAKQLIAEVVNEIAEVAGFRLEREPGETESRYFDALKNHISALRTGGTTLKADAVNYCRTLAIDLVKALEDL